MAEEVGLKLTLDIAKAKSDAEALAKKIEKLTKDFGENSKEVQEAQKEYDSLNKNIKELEKSQEPLSGQLEKITKQLQILKLNGQENTKEYANLIAEAGKLKDAMQDTEKAISLVASDTSNLDAILGAASAASGGFGLYVSAMSLLGKDTEDVQKSQKKLMQAIALVNSVQQISNALNKDSALMVKLNAVAHKLFAKQMEATAVATRGASGAMKGFKAALVSTGIGALVVALGFAVSKLIEFIDKQKEAADNAKGLNDKLKEQDKNFKEITKSAKEASENALGFFESLAFSGLESDLQSQLRALKKLYDDGTITEEEYYEKSLQTTQDYNKKEKELLDANQALIESSYGNRVDIIKDLDDANKRIKIGYSQIIEIQDKARKEGRALTEDEEKTINLWKDRIESHKNNAKDYENQITKLDGITKKRNELTTREWDAEKALSDYRIRKAKEYNDLLLNINEAIKNNDKTLRDMLADSVKDNPEEYFKVATDNILKDRDEAAAKENERYEAEKEKLKGNTKALEDEEKLHQQNMQIIYLTWKSKRKQLEDDFTNYLEGENEKRIQAEKEAQEKIIALREQLNAAMASLTSLKGKYDNPFKVDTTEMKNEYDQWTSLFKEALETNLINKKQYDDLMADADEVYRAKQNEAMWSTVGNYINYYSTLASYATQIMDNLTSLESENSKEAFERNKKSQIASAWVNGIAGAAGAFAQSMAQYGLPYGAIIGAAGSAATLAATAAQVANIKKQQWQNGTGVGKTSSGSGSSGTTSANTKPSSVSNTIISRNIPNTVVQPKTETVLVVDEVTAKQMEQENVKRVSTI